MTQNTEAPDGAAPRRVVVGIDTSDNSARAAAWAAREAFGRGLPLHLVYATDLPGPIGMVIEPVGYAQSRRKEAQALLDRVADDLREQQPGLTVTTEVSELAAAQTLVALSEGADFVVTGTRGHGGFTGMLLGSVSLALAAHSHCPAVVVRGEEPAPALNEIVLGIGPAQQAEGPVRFAFASAAALGATIAAVRAWQPASADTGYYHVLDIPQTEAKIGAELTHRLEAVRAQYPGVEVSEHVIRGNPVTVLINASRGSRMLVVGAHRRHNPLSSGTGYVVQGLLPHCPTPVAVVPVG